MVKPPAEGPAQLKKPDFLGFVARKLSGLWLTLWERKAMAFVPASRMAEHPKQWWTIKIRGKCAGKRPGKARELALAKPNTRTFSTANVFNAKDESWYMLVRFNVEKLNNENLYCIPLCMGSQQKKICYSTREAILLVFFSMSWLAQCPGICKNRFFDFDCRSLGKRLARTLHNPSNRLKGESGAGTLLAETRHNPAELNWRKPGTQRILAAPGGAAEPSGTRRNPAETWRNSFSKTVFSWIVSSALLAWGAAAAWAALLWNQGPRNQLVQSNARRWTLETFNRQLGRR